MPMYDWRCTECGADIAVIRPADNNGDMPTPEELAESKVATCNHVGGHDWRRVYGAVIVTKGPNWNGGKGAW